MDSSSVVRIALDVMGGDHAPRTTLDGARLALANHANLHLQLVGDEGKLRPLLKHHGLVGDLGLRCEIVHAPSVVTMEDKPTSVLKDKKDSSIRIACQLVREGKADGVVSMGNTGAAMVASVMVIGTLDGVDRPCLAGVMPNAKGRPTVLLDVGANVDSKPEHVAQFAVMGSVYAEEVLGIQAPRVGLLSVGEEDSKGNEITKASGVLLREMGIAFQGNAEGRDIWNGNFDVVACDGFVGNVVLKSSEALAESIVRGLRESISQNLRSKVGGLLVRPAMRSFMKKLDYAEYGGAPLLGVKGVSIIGHGRSDGRAVASAIRVAVRASEHRINDLIQASLHKVLPNGSTGGGSR
ncbi:MAG: phosphate acyltransferase PlsX [Firmicutes bacterium]|nr:phosphate acyltransferase PlsX [Bacillota bacterium]